MATATPRTYRTSEEWDEFARELLPELQAGATIESLRDRIGANGDALRTALARIGFDPKGEPYSLKSLTGKTPAAKAKKVATRRRAGAPWWLIMAESGDSYASLVDGLREHGFTTKGEAVEGGEIPETE